MDNNSELGNKWNNRVFIVIRLWLYVAIPITLLLLPATYFDNGESLCLSILLLGQECYACGMTRAMMHLIHLDFADAVYFNPISFLVLPLLIYVWAKFFWKDWRTYRGSK